MGNDIIYRGPSQNVEFAYIIPLPQMDYYAGSPSFKGNKNKEGRKEAF